MGRTTNKQRRAATQQSARERAAAMRIEQQRRERRRRALTIGGVTVAVLAVVGVIVGLGLGGGGGGSGALSTASAAVMRDVASVPPATLSSVGTSGLNSQYASGVPHRISDAALTSDGKPELLYIGAEFCPYCAGLRWPMAVALSRFGSLSGVGEIRSAATDGNLATLTFRDARYTSRYLSFAPVENEDRDHKPLQNTTAAQLALWKKYASSGGGLSYPFLDFGGKYVAFDPTFDPFSVLGGMTQTEIAKALNDPSSDVAKAVDTDANFITAAICGMTGNKPASVCTASIKAIEQKLPAYAGGAGTGSTASPSPSG